MVKADIFSGFLGAGKTTLIKKLISEGYEGEKLVLIENEFGDVGIDGGFMREAGIEITEMNSGCICCSLVGDFSKALTQVCEDFSPDRILIEPSGVGKLSDIVKAVGDVPGVEIDSTVAVADATRCKMYINNFGEFYNDQISCAGTIVLSRTDKLSDEKLTSCLELLHERNGGATIITTPWDKLSGKQILEAVSRSRTLHSEIEKLRDGTCPVCGHSHDEHDENGIHHDHEDHDHHGHHGHEGHGHEHHHHEHGDDCGCGNDHHHEHGDDCGCGNDHHHEHGDDCGCGHDHHHHDADEVFMSWGIETAKKFTRDELEAILSELDDSAKYGIVLRAKGIVSGGDSWLHFDHVPGEGSVRGGSAEVTGRLCVIGSQLNENALRRLFRV